MAGFEEAEIQFDLLDSLEGKLNVFCLYHIQRYRHTRRHRWHLSVILTIVVVDCEVSPYFVKVSTINRETFTIREKRSHYKNFKWDEVIKVTGRLWFQDKNRRCLMKGGLKANGGKDTAYWSLTSTWTLFGTPKYPLVCTRTPANDILGEADEASDKSFAEMKRPSYKLGSPFSRRKSWPGS